MFWESCLSISALQENGSPVGCSVKVLSKRNHKIIGVSCHLFPRRLPICPYSPENAPLPRSFGTDGLSSTFGETTTDFALKTQMDMNKPLPFDRLPDELRQRLEELVVTTTDAQQFDFQDFVHYLGQSWTDAERRSGYVSPEGKLAALTWRTDPELVAELLRHLD